MFSQIGEQYHYIDILEATNSQIADMWLHRKIVAIHLFKDEVRLHFYWLHKEDEPAVVYLPFIDDKQRKIIVEGASDDDF